MCTVKKSSSPDLFWTLPECLSVFEAEIQQDSEITKEVLDALMYGIHTALASRQYWLDNYQKWYNTLAIDNDISVSTKAGPTVHIKGNVYSAGDNENITGASVMISGTRNGTVTDAFGNFEIDVHLGEELVISYMGYKTEKIRIQSNTQPVIYVAMTEDQDGVGEILGEFILSDVSNGFVGAIMGARGGVEGIIAGALWKGMIGSAGGAVGAARNR